MGPEGWGPKKFALFFSSPAPIFALFVSLWVSSRGILVVLSKAGALKCARLEFSGCNVKPAPKPFTQLTTCEPLQKPPTKHTSLGRFLNSRVHFSPTCVWNDLDQTRRGNKLFSESQLKYALQCWGHNKSEHRATRACGVFTASPGAHTHQPCKPLKLPCPSVHSELQTNTKSTPHQHQHQHPTPNTQQHNNTSQKRIGQKKIGPKWIGRNWIGQSPRQSQHLPNTKIGPKHCTCSEVGPNCWFSFVGQTW